MTTDFDDLDVIDHATALIAAQYVQALYVQADRAADPNAHLEYGRDLNLRAVATRAVGELLKAGMLVTPLTPAELESLQLNSQPMGAEEAAEIRRRYRRMGGQG